MRRLIDLQVLALGLALLAAGCGGSGTAGGGNDGLVMAFQEFNGDGIDQADAVFQTAAQVDVCRVLCQSGGGTGEIMPEPFTSTFVNAVFVNNGKADIVLDSYTLFVAGSGVPAAVRPISARLPGGRCLGGDPQKACIDDRECFSGDQQGSCVHRETSVTILLYDFDFKQRVIQGECPFDVVPLTLDAELTFVGTDETDEQFTFVTHYVSTFDNFDNCENN